jgi:acetyl esterase/lipase
MPGRKWTRSTARLLVCGCVITGVILQMGPVFAENNPVRSVETDGTVVIPAMKMPPSRYASPEANAKLRPLPAPPNKAPSTIFERRKFYGAFNDRLAARMRAMYPVRIRKAVLDGVPVEIVEPVKDTASNAGRILINLHGGAFMWGSGNGGEVEAIPVAATAHMTVVTIDYRLAPENHFPAASEDVASVYRVLLRTHVPAQIGIYGCSAGGILTAESIAWFDKVGLPMPGAIGTFCGSAAQFSGDSIHLATAITGDMRTEGQEMAEPYFADADAKSPLVFPANSERLMRRFPPTLLIAGSRDYSVSSLFYTQRMLTRVGVTAELHVWDGLPHAFLVDPNLPESREAYSVIADFFSRHLINTPKRGSDRRRKFRTRRQ